MTATTSGTISSFLRWAGLVLGMLAIIAGILGMHVMTGSHTMHAAAAAGAGAGAGMAHTAEPGDAGHSHLGAPGAVPAAATPGNTDTASCPDPGPCPSAASMGGVCIPAPGPAPLAAPPPGSAPFALQPGPGLSVTFGGYPYRPGSPSPGELSISRT
ncbi:hypothetical protein [Arthrobacter sp. B2a2-09]|uniref:hypothetical protein n=1 Tax=Arthrobacter sp. B2a2-09 TaxID=2952822 RepID=UPI0022CD52A0|nr:hypothetical protein [Arthrobacter sp. B2a2-09]MCZ9880190.1 hypothetical protein [Arthrobacter sp. B2a2-09]